MHFGVCNENSPGGQVHFQVATFEESSSRFVPSTAGMAKCNTNAR